MIHRVLLCATFAAAAVPVAWFDCPDRCQCYEDPEDRSHAVHLICKWEQVVVSPSVCLICRAAEKNFGKSEYAILFSLTSFGLRNLDRLEIDRCILDELPPDLFMGLTQLNSLILRSARLRDLPNSLLEQTPNLMTIDLTVLKFDFCVLPANAFRNVVHVDLSNNSITFLANTLVNLPKLRVLTMDHNKLTNIDFRRFPDELTDLSLRHNAISTLHFIPPSVPNLRRLDLAHNLVDFVSGTGTVNLLPPSLKTVDLSFNRIAFVQDGTLERMEDLILLDLKNNSLTELRESSLAGPKNRLRLLAALNPFACSCSLRWMLHPTTKSTPTVLDLAAIQCSHILKLGAVMNVTVADARNELLCKYENQCPASCQCCGLPFCECRIECPRGCHCYRSARDDVERLVQNIVSCEGQRIDRLRGVSSVLVSLATAQIPLTTTELRLSGDWGTWTPEQLGRMHQLHTLNITSSGLKAIEPAQLENLPRLSALDLSGNQFSRPPVVLPGITQLYLNDNPLKEFTPKDLLMFEGLRKLSFGGNSTAWECDCDAPSPLQRWLRDKVRDIETVSCSLPLHGTVQITKTLPESDDSLCHKESENTAKWVDLLKTLEGRTSTIRLDDFTTTTLQPKRMPFTAKTEMLLPTDFVEQTKAKTIGAYRPTWVPPKRRLREDPDDSHRFLNALIFVLFVAVILLIVAVGITLYFRFTRTDVLIGSRHKPSLEQRPLNA